MANRNQYTYTPGYQGAGRQMQERSVAPRPGGVRNSAPQAARPAGDTVILALLFIVAPLCGILGIFIKMFLWVFVSVTSLALVAMWALHCFEQRGRAFLSGVLVVLIAMALIFGIDMSPEGNYFPSYGNDTNAVNLQSAAMGNGMNSTHSQNDQNNQGNQDQGSNSGNQNNPAFVGLGSSSPAPTSPIGVSDPVSEETNEGSGLDWLASGQPRTVASAAQEVMDKYMQMWQAQNYEGMVELATPEWRNAQKVPQRQLNWNHNGWILNSWTIVPEAQSPSADSVTLTVIANLEKNVNTKTPATSKYSALVLNKNGTWYVDPDSMRNGVPVTESQAVVVADGSAAAGDTGSGAVAPSPTTDPGLKLWRNTSGGQMYHLQEKCPSINAKNYVYMRSFTFSEINNSDYAKLKPCNECNAPKRP